jgi:hypothetical protein
VLLKISLHDGVFDCRVNRCIDHGRIAVSCPVNADAANEIQLDTAVSHFNVRSISKTRSKVRPKRRTATSLTQTLQQRLKVLGQIGASRFCGRQAGSVICDGFGD